jgi:carbamoyl-phosphate synthase small subunit
MTYPLIGNYGVPSFSKNNGIMNYLESEEMQISGLIVSTYIENNDHWQSKQTLSSWLKKEGIPAIESIDTRTLTKTLREKGVMKGKIVFNNSRPKSGFSFHDINTDNLVAKVSCQKIQVYGNGKFRLLFIDCGMKYSQIKILLKYDTTIIRVPWNYKPFIDRKLKFDAVMVSNGPGDPKMAKETIETVKEVLLRRIPVLGICLGNQILALAIGADTFKLKYGHRGQNQPVKDIFSGRCFITTQNHGFAVNPNTLKDGWKEWFTNLNDQTCEGIMHENLPFFSSQFHPEETPGPTDTEWVFNFFISEAKKHLKKYAK